MLIEEIIEKWEKAIKNEYQYEEEIVFDIIKEFIKDLEECEEKGSCNLSGL